MRAHPRVQPTVSNTRPKARAEAAPEQKTKISVASLKPNRAGIASAHPLSGTCATKMMNIPRPRKKSSRGSRGPSRELHPADIGFGPQLADDYCESVAPQTNPG